MKIVSFLFFLSFLAANPSIAQEDDEAIKVLFIGNSFTYMNDMAGLFEKMATNSGKEVIVESNTKGGASFKEHTGRKDMYRAINKRKWDYIILQGYSREMTYPKEYLDTATMPYIDQILDSIYQNNSCTNVLFYMTWGYEVGYPSREEIKTFEMMADTIRNGYKFIGNHYKIPVVPVGMVWKELRKRKDYDFYISDQFHPNINGSYLVASTFFSAIFNEQNEDFRPFGVRKRQSKVIAETAFKYVTEHSDEYKLNQNYIFMHIEEGRKSNHKLEFNSSFEDATKYLWKFGDGEESDQQSGVHLFKESGKYEVNLIVESDCGAREYRQMVNIQYPKRARRIRLETESEE